MYPYFEEMPTIHGYKNEPGVYIRAMPSDAGNITYQVSRGAEEQVKKLGYRDGDEIPWTVINVFRRMDEIYTHGSGTDKNDVSLEIDSEAIETLSLEQKWKLVAYLLSDGSLDKKETVELMSDILTVGEWQELVDKTSNDQRELPEKVERAIQEHGKNIKIEQVIHNGELQKSITQLFEHPCELDEISYIQDHRIVYHCELNYNADKNIPIILLDWRPFDEANTIQSFDVPGDMQEMDFEFSLASNSTSCVLYVRDGHMILPEHLYIPEEDEYRHAHLENIADSFDLCREFFKRMNAYDLNNPNPDPIQP